VKRILLTGAAGSIATAVRPVLRELARIGTFEERPATTRDLSTWLSPGDAGRLVRAALSGPADGFLAVYAVSANKRAWWDLPPQLGYAPQDDAEDYAAAVGPDDGVPFQGGPATARESGGWAV
jgi:uronate dehydrogenase